MKKGMNFSYKLGNSIYNIFLILVYKSFSNNVFWPVKFKKRTKANSCKNLVFSCVKGDYEVGMLQIIFTDPDCTKWSY